MVTFLSVGMGWSASVTGVLGEVLSSRVPLPLSGSRDGYRLSERRSKMEKVLDRKWQLQM